MKLLLDVSRMETTATLIDEENKIMRFRTIYNYNKNDLEIINWIERQIEIYPIDEVKIATDNQPFYEYLSAEIKVSGTGVKVTKYLHGRL